jgi:hypothetical protein
VSIRSVVLAAVVGLILAACAPATTSEPAQPAPSPTAIPAGFIAGAESDFQPGAEPNGVGGPFDTAVHCQDRGWKAL